MATERNNIDPNKWLATYADELFGYAMAKTSNVELSEDIVQETFLAGLKSVANFKGESSERTWLYSILKNKIADHYKKASTRYEINHSRFTVDDNSFLDNFFDEDGGWNESAAPMSWSIDYNNAIENKELAQVLSGCIKKLPPNQKQLVLLKIVEEEETEKICKELSITATNYWVIIHRAKLLLRACIEKNWFKA